MGYEVSVKPPKVRISVAGGSSKHTIINHCARNLAYKIVFPDNSLYSVSPPDVAVGVIEIGRTVDIEIQRKAGKGPHEEMVIEYFPVAQGGEASKSTYGELANKTIVKLIPDG